MDLNARGYEKVLELLRMGVDIPNPLTLDIGPEVDTSRISGHGVVIYPGCRIYGSKTVISSGVVLGAEGPVTIEDCRLGPDVQLKGGYFKKAVFLRKANMGLGAHVREGTLLEEEANGAHCVGLKQTILFPFVTLGSLINFCDCLMAGGTSRKDHSEVGSSYIHFNFTPDGDKTTPSLFGDVPRGVMLDQPPIFLGGQGGAVGPLRMGYGTVVAAGSILLDDVASDRQFVISGTHTASQRPFAPHAYRHLERVVANNIVYLANLVALEQWYRLVRRPFFESEELGSLVYEGALEVLSSAKKERTSRLTSMAGKVSPDDPPRKELRERVEDLCELFNQPELPPADDFLRAFEAATERPGADYVGALKGLPPDVRGAGVAWLQQIVDTMCARAGETLPSMNLFAAV